MEKYITLLASDDYLPGTLALNHQLKKVQSTRDLICLISNDLSNKTLRTLSEEKIRTLCRPPLIVPKNVVRQYRKTHPNWLRAFSKFYLFTLKDYSKLVYLDSDMLVRQNIDDLFDRPGFSAVPDGIHEVDTDVVNPLNAGLLVVEPSRQIFRWLIGAMTNAADLTSKINEERIFQKVFPNWRNNPKVHLPFTYNMSSTYLGEMDQLGLELDDLKVIHFDEDRVKPWAWTKAQKDTYLLRGPIFSKAYKEYAIIIEKKIAQYGLVRLRPNP